MSSSPSTEPEDPPERRWEGPLGEGHLTAGPPADWLARVQAAAPELLDPTRPAPLEGRVPMPDGGPSAGGMPPASVVWPEAEAEAAELEPEPARAERPAAVARPRDVRPAPGSMPAGAERPAAAARP
ncbi:MAG TPA: hypothetical protein VIC57_00700, partial [Candidatus Dormibacteraeota bacterium]